MNSIKNVSITLFLFCTILFLMIVYLYLQNHNCQNDYINMQNRLHTMQSIIKDKEELVDDISNKVNLIHEANGVKLNPTININTENNEPITLNRIIGNGPKLIFRYSEIHCQVCVDNEIKRLNKVLSEFGEENILIFSYYNSYRNLGRFKRINQLHAQIYNIKDLGLNIEKKNLPYYFVIDENMKIKDVMIPDKYLPKISDTYLNIIKNKYFNKSILNNGK